MIKYVYSIDYPLGQKRAYLEWVRSIADTLQKPDELVRLTSYDNVFSASPHRVHCGGRPRMERRWVSRLRYRDAQHRQVGAGWSTARTVLHSADVYPVASGTDDWPLPMSLRPANSGHSHS